MAKKAAPKRKAWLKAYLDEGSPTFLNASASARKAGYRAKQINTFEVIGHQNFIKLKSLISTWLDENGFSDARLKTKLLRLVEAKKTVFQKLSGSVNQEDLPDGHRIVVKTGKIIYDEDGKALAGDGDCLIEIDVEALEIQRQSLDMAFKAMQLYPPDRKEVSGPGGGPLEVKAAATVKMDAKALDDAIAGCESKRKQ